jgi:hypothetical protein
MKSQNDTIYYVCSYELWGYDLRVMSTSAEEAFELLYAEYVRLWKEDGGEPTYTKNEMASNVDRKCFKLNDVYHGDTNYGDYSFLNKYSFFGGSINV